MVQERRQTCIDHAQKLGEVTTEVKYLRNDVNEFISTVKDYMADGKQKRAQVDTNTAFREKHESVLNFIHTSREVVNFSFKCALVVCTAIITITGAIWGLKRLEKEKKECKSVGSYFLMAKK